MRWLPLSTSLRVMLPALAAYFLYPCMDQPDWTPARQEFALKWRATIKCYPEPELARAKQREIVARRFDTKEWVFGVCRDAQGITDGGALVVKDSTGQTRVFFGQGCLSSTLPLMMLESKSLADFYSHDMWAIFQFLEYELP